MAQTYLQYLGRDGFTDETLLVIDIVTPLVEGTEGVHCFALTKTAMGMWLPKKEDAPTRIIELLAPHFEAKDINPVTGIPASLGTLNIVW